MFDVLNDDYPSNAEQSFARLQDTQKSGVTQELILGASSVCP